MDLVLKMGKVEMLDLLDVMVNHPLHLVLFLPEVLVVRLVLETPVNLVIMGWVVMQEIREIMD
jgi:hypothetical protein